MFYFEYIQLPRGLKMISNSLPLLNYPFNQNNVVKYFLVKFATNQSEQTKPWQSFWASGEKWTIPSGPNKRNSRYSRFFRTLLWSRYLFFTLLDRASFPYYNNTKIIKFGWELFILWVISYRLSFSGFARFPEFRGTINDSFGRP